MRLWTQIYPEIVLVPFSEDYFANNFACEKYDVGVTIYFQLFPVRFKRLEFLVIMSISES